MWVARDLYGELHLFIRKPERCDRIGGEIPNDEVFYITPCVWRIRRSTFGGFYDIYGYIKIDDNLFPDLRWEDEPIEVDITIKDKPIKFCLSDEAKKMIEKDTGKTIEELRNQRLI